MPQFLWTLGLGCVTVAEAAQVEDLALGGVECLAKGLDFLAVPPLEFGELGGEGAHDAAGVVVRRRCRGRPGVLLLCPELLDAPPYGVRFEARAHRACTVVGSAARPRTLTECTRLMRSGSTS